MRPKNCGQWTSSFRTSGSVACPQPQIAVHIRRSRRPDRTGPAHRCEHVERRGHAVLAVASEPSRAIGHPSSDAEHRTCPHPASTSTPRAQRRRRPGRRGVTTSAVRLGPHQIWEVAAEFRAGRWAAHGRQSIAVHTGPLPTEGDWWRALFEVGSRAVLDGATALRAAGMTGYDDRLHVAVPKSARPRLPHDVIVHETRRLRPEDIIAAGVPRTRPAIAAVHGALWARTDRQAAMLLTMAVHQRCCTPQELGEAVLAVRRHRRRQFLRSIALDLLGGVRSLPELDFARMCRRRGLPEPTRQSVRSRAGGRYVLDAEWKAWRVIVEIDGIQHLDAREAVADAARHNDVGANGSQVLRIPTLGLRVDPDRFLDQVEAALRRGGWDSAIEPALRPNN